jgi:2-alkenal reductase
MHQPSGSIPEAKPPFRQPLAFLLAVLLAAVIGGVIGGAVAAQLGSAQPDRDRSVVQPQATVAVPISMDINTSVTDAVAKVGPAVVTVINHLPPRRTLFGLQQGATSTGSGVIIDSDGHIVTNNHVVEGAESLEIILADGSSLPAELVGVDSFADLTLIKVAGDIPEPAVWGNSDSLKPGETVIAIGSPLGDFNNTVTVGVVSATERTLDVDRNYQLVDLIQTDAAINQGNSGGPLINLSGQIVGINTIVVRGSGQSGAIAEGLGFAIASNTARAVTDQLVEKGFVSRPALGIRWGWITPELARRYDLPVRYGVYVAEVLPEGPADQAGVRRGDILVGIDDQAFSPDRPYINFLFEYEPGDSVRFNVVRGAQELEIEIILGTSAST